MMLDGLVGSAFRTLWYTIVFISWVFKAFFVTLSNMSNRRR